MTYFVFDNGQWVERQPVGGERFRMIDSAGGVLESYWEEHTEPYIGSMSVTVDGQPKPRHVATAGVENTYRIECSLPITDNFAVPLEGLLGAKGRTVMFDFINGIAERAITFTESGEWTVTEEQINKHLPIGQRFRFAGLNLSVAE